MRKISLQENEKAILSNDWLMNSQEIFKSTRMRESIKNLKYLYYSFIRTLNEYILVARLTDQKYQG